MIKINLLRIEGKKDILTAARWHEGRGAGVPWFRYDLAWAAWIGQHFTPKGGDHGTTEADPDKGTMATESPV